MDARLRSLVRALAVELRSARSAAAVRVVAASAAATKGPSDALRRADRYGPAAVQAARDCAASKAILVAQSGPITVRWSVLDDARFSSDRTMALRLAARLAAVAAVQELPLQRVLLHVVPTDAPRLWPPPNRPIEAAHVNGGFTFTGAEPADAAEIFVFRREDAMKVAIHELLHHALPRTLTEPLGAAAEALVEAWAIVHQACLLAAERGQPSDATALLAVETEWALKQDAALRGGGGIDRANAASYFSRRAALLTRLDELFDATLRLDVRALRAAMKLPRLTVPQAEAGIARRRARASSRLSVHGDA